MSIRLLLADDHDLVRAGLRVLLEREADLEVVAEVGDGAAVLDAVRAHRPEVAVIDVTMPGLNGVEVARTLAAEQPETRVLAVSMHTHRRYVQEMLKAGALGYVTKRAATPHLVEALRAVAAGRRYLCPTAAAALAEEYGAATPVAAGGLATLNPRERQIVQWLAEGRNSKQIAQELGVSIRTVDANRQQVMEKLGLASVAELTRFAIREGLTPLDV